MELERLVDVSGLTWPEKVATNVAAYGNLVAGIDPYLPDVPSAFTDHRSTADWLPGYLDFILDTIRGRIGFAKFQSAYFEACGLSGLAALSAAMKRAHRDGLGVILDAKRGDIGPTAAAYARAYLTPSWAGGSGDLEADCLTVSPLMGPDTLEPFLGCVRQYGKGLFVLCRTSNPGAGWLQDRLTGNRAVSERIADLIASVGRSADADPSRLSPVGAVVGATIPHEGRQLRKLLPNAIILAPGLGSQGGDPLTIKALRGSRPEDVLVPVSRGLFQAPDRAISMREYGDLIAERIHNLKRSIISGQQSGNS